MKRIYSAASLPEAHLLLYSLEQQDIAAKVFNENAQGGVGELPFTHAYPEVWIEHAEDEHRARLVVEKFESRARVATNTTCTACEEPNPATFDICWQCGAVLSDRDT